ncbi:MAG: hypothetical protein ACFFCS_01850 [Candidatus Hodarchaeota archaeon]
MRQCITCGKDCDYPNVEFYFTHADLGICKTCYGNYPPSKKDTIENFKSSVDQARKKASRKEDAANFFSKIFGGIAMAFIAIFFIMLYNSVTYGMDPLWGLLIFGGIMALVWFLFFWGTSNLHQNWTQHEKLMHSHFYIRLTGASTGATSSGGYASSPSYQSQASFDIDDEMHLDFTSLDGIDSSDLPGPIPLFEEKKKKSRSPFFNSPASTIIGGIGIFFIFLALAAFLQGYGGVGLTLLSIGVPLLCCGALARKSEAMSRFKKSKY